MAEFYKQERHRQERVSRAIGIALAGLAHASLLVFGLFSGLDYLYPPPPEQENILIEFMEADREKVEERFDGTQPRAVDADPSKELELVQKSEAQMEGTKANEAPEATVGEDGDVEVPEPPRPKEINKRALFHAAKNNTEKDTLAPQTADKASAELKTGHAEGNTLYGKTNGEPNARVKGRSVVGTLPAPSYSVQASGTVVVDIEVDRTGKVVQAIPGGQGTTVSDPELWNAARKAAMEARFNPNPNAVANQPGTITYIFKLKS